MMRAKAAGVLLHISSLPGAYGIGDLGPSAYAWVDFLKSAKISYWQILPINPTDGINGHSPYSSLSAFAGNPLFISPDVLVSEGLLSRQDVKPPKGIDLNSVDYAKVIIYKEHLLTLAYRQFKKSSQFSEYNSFVAHNPWLDDYALFCAAKTAFANKAWNDWPKDIKERKPAGLKRLAQQHSDLVGKIKFTQYVFFRQWKALKAYANDHGIGIIGDIPIYVNYDSVDVWCYPQYFKLDARGNVKFVSGCPPDYFSRTGQRWGNPVYDWDNLKKDRYAWWVKRIQHNLTMCDYLRIDHFRGFLSFWQIPAHEKLAVFGRWVKGPRDDFFKQLLKNLGKINIIAEDLGEITPDVPILMKKFNIPGMRVLLFAFGDNPKNNPHAPKNYTTDNVVYTGTHDNNTIQGWFRQEAKGHERTNIAMVLGKKVNARQLHWQLMEALMRSKAKLAIVPAGDLLGLGEEGRMNTPATKVSNWQWRLRAGQNNAALAKKLRTLVHSTGRDK